MAARLQFLAIRPDVGRGVPVRRAHARAARRRRRVVDARIREPSRAGSRARVDESAHRQHDRRPDRVRHLLQLRVSVVRVAAAARPAASISRASPLHEIGHFSGLGHSALGETELRDGGGRRVISLGSSHVSDCVHLGKHRGSHAESRRHRGHLGSVSRRRLRQRGQPVGPRDEERRRAVRRARDRVRSGDRARWSPGSR